MFLTETAQRADVVLPAASTYEKDGTLTNTAGEVQLTHRSIDAQGPRSDFDLLRILSHQLSHARAGLADSNCAPPRRRSTKSASTWRDTIFRTLPCLPAARNKRRHLRRGA